MKRPTGLIYLPSKRNCRAVRMSVRQRRLHLNVTKTFVLEEGRDRDTALVAAIEAAEQWAADTIASVRQKAVAPDKLRLTVRGLIETYLKDDVVKAKRTIEDKERLLQWWDTEYGHVRVNDFDVLKIREARDLLNNGKRGPATVNRYLTEMRSAWTWGRSTKHINIERLWPSKIALPEPPKRVRYLSDAELATLLDKAAPEPMLYAAIVTSIATGLRQSELLRLQWHDLDLTAGAGKVYIGQSKNGERRQVYLPDPAIDALKKLRGDGTVIKLRGPVFVLDDADSTPVDIWRLNSRWKKVRKAAKLSNFRWHDLRHSCASYLAQHGATLLEIGSVLGHKSAAATLRYAHLVSGKPVTGHAALAAKLRGKS